MYGLDADEIWARTKLEAGHLVQWYVDCWSGFFHAEGKLGKQLYWQANTEYKRQLDRLFPKKMDADSVGDYFVIFVLGCIAAIEASPNCPPLGVARGTRQIIDSNVYWKVIVYVTGLIVSNLIPPDSTTDAAAGKAIFVVCNVVVVLAFAHCTVPKFT